MCWRKGCFFIKLIKLKTFIPEYMDHSDCMAYSNMTVSNSMQNFHNKISVILLIYIRDSTFDLHCHNALLVIN